LNLTFVAFTFASALAALRVRSRVGGPATSASIASRRPPPPKLLEEVRRQAGDRPLETLLFDVDDAASNAAAAGFGRAGIYRGGGGAW